jgi:hypothetical protein
MTQEVLDFNAPAPIVHCACCPTQKANRRAIDANVVRIGRRSQETSVKAAQAVLPRTGTKRWTVFEMIKGNGSFGLCDHEIEELTGWRIPTVTATRNSLLRDYWIYDSGVRRKTPRGNEAIVWIASN